MSDKTGPLTLAEFETLANLTRRFEMNHTGDNKVRRALAKDMFLSIRNVYIDLYVPNMAAPADSEYGRRRQFAEGTTAEARERWTDSDGSPVTSEIGG